MRDDVKHEVRRDGYSGMTTSSGKSDKVYLHTVASFIIIPFFLSFLDSHAVMLQFELI